MTVAIKRTSKPRATPKTKPTRERRNVTMTLSADDLANLDAIGTALAIGNRSALISFLAQEKRREIDKGA